MNRLCGIMLIALSIFGTLFARARATGSEARKYTHHHGRQSWLWRSTLFQLAFADHDAASEQTGGPRALS